jgi:hypothetical protein
MAFKFKKSDLKKSSGDFANYLQVEVQAALEARAALKDRWDQNEEIYRNEQEGNTVQLYDNFEPRSTPIMSPRINRIVNVTMTTLTSPSVWVQAYPDDKNQKGADALERGNQTILQRSGLKRTLRRGLKTAALDGLSIIRVRMTVEGLQTEYIHPNDFIVSPTYGLNMEQTHLAGHRFSIPLWKMQDRVKDGTYDLIKPEDVTQAMAKDPDETASGFNPATDKSQSEVDGQDRMTDMVELFECLVRIMVGNKRKWVRAVINLDQSQVVMVEDYNYPRPWYFDLRFHDEAEKFWPATSIAQNIKGLCMLYNDMANLLVAGSMGTAVTPTIISGGTLGKKVTNIGLGQLIQTAHEVKVQGLPQNFDAGAMPALMQELSNLIDAETGISQNSIGQENLSSQTATEAAALEANKKQNEGAYAEFSGAFLEEISKWVTYLVRVHTASVRSWYGQALEEEYFGAIRNRVRWESTGSQTGNSPQVLTAKLEALMALTSQEQSEYHYGRVENAIVNAMQLPMKTEALRKTEEEKQLEAEQRQEAIKLQIALSQGTPPGGGNEGVA